MLPTGLAPGRLALVIIQPGVIQHFLPDEDAQRVRELQMLDEEIVLGLQVRPREGRLEIEGQPFLDAREARAPGQVEEEEQVEDDRRREDRVAAEEVDLDLHRLAEPPDDVDVVPALLGVAAGRVVLDADLVEVVAVELGVELGLEDRVEDRSLAHFLRLERAGIVEHLAVAVAEDVGREPALEADHPGLQSRGDDRLHQRLAGLEVLAGDRHAAGPRHLLEGRDVDRQVRRAVGVRHAARDRGVRVDHGRRDVGGVRPSGPSRTPRASRGRASEASRPRSSRTRP